LQPLVENCVVHAFKNREERSSILVRAEMKGRFLVLTVADNGSGMDGKTIEGLLHPLPIDASSSRVMGLENIIQRLYFFYPDDPGVIRIESAPGRGSTIIISIDTEREACTEF
jgi:sensor histidine kinase YesM